MSPFAHFAATPVAIPLLVAALLSGIGGRLPRWLLDGVAILTTIATTVICCGLVCASADHTIVYWLGSWSPDPNPAGAMHFPVGICFSIDPIGAGLAALVSLLGAMAFVFSWSYFEQVRSLYHALMLGFIGAMCGLCLTGDLFNLFVWFELMTAAAVALCGYKSEESWPLLGAVNFAVINTLGAFLSLCGVALLYARTGSLNMAEVGRSLAAQPAGGAALLVIFLFVITGFLVKMAVVPFQFWLADAHAVAPTPVCVLFSGVMVELGLYAIARLHWLVFAPALGAADESVIHNLFLVVGSATAVVGALFCFGQRHLKRLLAFSTISHVGLMTIGFALLDPGALSGTAVYVIGHGMIKGALFLGAGILLHRCGSVDEFDLRGHGQGLWPLGLILTIGAIGLLGAPPFATFYGEAQIHKAIGRQHLEWVTAAAIFAEGLTAGAVIRFTGRVFLGLGKVREASSRGAPHIPMDTETAGQHETTPIWMWLPAVVLLALAALLAIPHPLRNMAAAAAIHFEQTQLITNITLNAGPDRSFPTTVGRAEVGMENIVAPVVGLAVAALALFPGVFGRRANWIVGRGVIAVMRPLRRFQSGNICDYVAWFSLGIAAYGTLLLLW